VMPLLTIAARYVGVADQHRRSRGDR